MKESMEGSKQMRKPQAIGLEDLRKCLEAGTVQEFWNVLTHQYFSSELIPGSRHVPLDTVGRASTSMPKSTSIVVYCSNYECPQSHVAAEKLAALGFTEVYVYEGGLQEWEEAGYPLVPENQVLTS